MQQLMYAIFANANVFISKLCLINLCVDWQHNLPTLPLVRHVFKKPIRSFFWSNATNYKTRESLLFGKNRQTKITKQTLSLAFEQVIAIYITKE